MPPATCDVCDHHNIFLPFLHSDFFFCVNFGSTKESNELIRLLPSAVFVAIDEEMTGIVMPNSTRPRKDQTPGQRYEQLKAVPEYVKRNLFVFSVLFLQILTFLDSDFSHLAIHRKYSIIQLGICLFHEHPNFDPAREGTPQFIAVRNLIIHGLLDVCLYVHLSC